MEERKKTQGGESNLIFRLLNTLPTSAGYIGKYSKSCLNAYNQEMPNVRIQVLCCHA